MRIDDGCVVILSTEVKTVLYIVGADQAATSTTGSSNLLGRQHHS